MTGRQSRRPYPTGKEMRRRTLEARTIQFLDSICEEAALALEAEVRSVALALQEPPSAKKLPQNSSDLLLRSRRIDALNERLVHFVWVRAAYGRETQADIAARTGLSVAKVRENMESALTWSLVFEPTTPAEQHLRDMIDKGLELGDSGAGRLEL